MSKLSDAMREARTTTKEIYGWKLRVLTPKAAELHRLIKKFQSQGYDEVSVEVEVCCKFVVGWIGVTNDMLLKTGTHQLVDFDKDAFREFLLGEPKFWQELVTYIYKLFEDAKKN